MICSKPPTMQSITNRIFGTGKLVPVVICNTQNSARPTGIA